MKRILFFVSVALLMLAVVVGCSSPKPTKVVKYTAIEKALKKVLEENGGGYSMTNVKREQLRRIASPVLDSMLRNLATYSDLVFNFTGDWKYTDEWKRDRMRVEFVAKPDLFHDIKVDLFVYIEMSVDDAAAINKNVDYKFLTGRFTPYKNEIQSWVDIGYKETVRMPFILASGVIME